MKKVLQNELNLTDIPELPKIDNIPPGMDLRQLPIVMLTNSLREWAQNLVINALNIDTQFDVHANDKLLQTLLPYRRTRTTFSWWQKLLNWWKKRIISQILTGFPQSSVEKIQQNPAALTIVQSFKKSHKNVDSKKRPKYMPDALWPLIGAMAWDNSVFQSWLATEIVAALRKRFLFLNGELPKISLRPEVFWLILELLKTPSVPKNRQIIHQCYQRSGWAGFWEQWLLMELLQRSIIQINVLKPELKELLIGLPILSLSNYGQLKKKLVENNTDKSGKFYHFKLYIKKLSKFFRKNKQTPSNMPTLPDIVNKTWRDALPSGFEQMPDWYGSKEAQLHKG